MRSVRKPIFKPGKRCGGTYEITAPVFQALHAETYEAAHRTTGESVTVTCSRFSHVEGDPPSEAAFTAAAEKLASLAVGEAPRIYGFGVSDGVYWVVSQAFGSPTIIEYHALQQGQPLAWRVLDTLSVALIVQSILGKAHALGVLHGNLRPASMVLCGLPSDCDPRLLELGYADLFRLNRAAAQASPRYRPPEQLAGDPIDERSDVYSLGMSVYHLIAQAPPYADKAPVSNSARLLEMAARELPTPLPELTKQCPPGVWDFVARAIDKDPAKRFQSAGEVGEAIEQLTNQILGDSGDAGMSARELERELAALLRGTGPFVTAPRPAPRAASGSDEPTTVPPGADTKRRIHAALTQAREGTITGDAETPSSKPTTPTPTPKSKPKSKPKPKPKPTKDDRPSGTPPASDPDSEPVTLPSAHQGIKKERPAQKARRSAWRAQIFLGGSVLAAGGLAALALVARASIRPSVAIAWPAPRMMLPEAPTAAPPAPVVTAAPSPHPTGSAAQPPAPAVPSAVPRLPRVRASAAPPTPSSVGSAKSPAEGPPADPCQTNYLCPKADPMPASSGTD